jgi:hypothetical protein
VTEVMHYRKKPSVVEAVQVLETCGQEVEAFTGGTHLEWEMADPDPADPGKGCTLTGLLLWVEASKAVCRLDPGDWIIREQDGSGFYPCKADVFAATYEPATAPAVDAGDVRLLVTSLTGIPVSSMSPEAFAAWCRLRECFAGAGETA